MAVFPVVMGFSAERGEAGMLATLLLHSGRIFDGTGLPSRPGVVAVCGPRILYAGPAAGWRGELAPGGRCVDVAGGLVTPGLIDAHTHVSEGGLAARGVDGCGVRSPEDLAQRARTRAAALPRGAFVTGRGWDERAFSGGGWPSGALLDAACPAHPVLLRRVCGHAAVANRLALRRAGIGPDTPDPPGGRIGRGPDGAPDGRLFEAALDLVRRVIPEASFEERCAGLRAALDQALRAGLTAVEDERGWPEVYAALGTRAELPCRVRVWNQLTRPLDELRAWRRDFRPRGRVESGLLKGYLDGSLGARTALFLEPYTDRPETAGVATFEPGPLAEAVCAADAAGFQVGLHAIGDRAVSRALDAFEQAARTNGPRDRRHRIEHAQHVARRDLERFARLGVTASMQPSHLSSDLQMVEPRLGAGRVAEAYPWRSLQAAGARVAFGSDYPIEPIDPRTSLFAAVTRASREGAARLGPAQEAIPLAEALRHFTHDAAYAQFAEHERGRLAPGYLADLTVWGVDLFRLPAPDLLSAPVRMTIVGGRVEHDAR